ncbi:MAG: hypothetical protein ACREIJ_00115 [Nitrospiraceae bacterium]
MPPGHAERLDGGKAAPSPAEKHLKRFFLSSLLEKQHVAYFSTLGYPDSPQASFGQYS